MEYNKREVVESGKLWENSQNQCKTLTTLKKVSLKSFLIKALFFHMFLGEYKHIIDEKGRIFIPTKFHAQLKAGAVLTRGLDNCLFLIPAKDWEVLAAKIKALPLTQSNSRAFSRLMLAGASETKLDSQGRMLVTDFLKQYAHIEKNVVIVGVYDRLEIWEEEAWERYKKQTEANSNDIAENLTNLGI